MKLLRELLLILAIFFLGEVISKGLKLPVPGNIVGMVILLLFLCFQVIKLHHIENISNFLLDHLAFFFVPAGVGLITSLDILKGNWYKILLVCFLTTIIIMVVTGKTIDLIKSFSKEEK
ncbi:CidA/LrgA family protein [Clostridium sp.]|uniref:CidA/LrgA family protein n=1 Tax=Clostridium sp. TaxID=1506 RepID=UPI003464C6A4